MKTSLFLIAVVSAQIASAQYNADGSPRINRQLRGLQFPAGATFEDGYGLEGTNPLADKTNSPTDSLASSKSGKSSEKGTKSEKV